MRQYLGIGLRDELIPLILHLFLQWNIVLNDSVMYYSNGTGVIHMGMGIDITGSTRGLPNGYAPIPEVPFIDSPPCVRFSRTLSLPTAFWC